MNHTHLRNALAVFLAVFTLAGSAAAQENRDRSLEGRLLEILRDRGVITDSEVTELEGLAEQMRREDDLGAQLDDQVDQLVASMGKNGATTSYKEGKGFTFTSGDKRFKLHVGGRLQVRLTYTKLHDEPDEDADDRPDFDVPRARVWLQGVAFENFKFKLQFDIAGDEADAPSGSSTNRLAEMKDGYVDYARSKGFVVRFGQFKVPYSRHQLASSGKQEFVDRAITDKNFARGRDIGLMIHGKAGGENSDLFEYYVGVFDGEGENKDNNDQGLLWAVRLALNPMGAVKYTESDLGNTEELRIAIGINAWIHQDDNFSDDEDDWSVGIDAVAFYQRLFVLVEGHIRENGVAGGPDVEITGLLLQVGYMVSPGTFEIAIRIAHIDFDDASTDSLAEYGIVFGYFVSGHNLKIQLDIRHIEEEDSSGSEEEEWQFRIQFQIIF